MHVVYERFRTVPVHVMPPPPSSTGGSGLRAFARALPRMERAAWMTQAGIAYVQGGTLERYFRTDDPRVFITYSILDSHAHDIGCDACYPQHKPTNMACTANGPMSPPPNPDLLYPICTSQMYRRSGKTVCETTATCDGESISVLSPPIHVEYIDRRSARVTLPPPHHTMNHSNVPAARKQTPGLE